MTIALPTATLNGAEITGPLTERYDVAHQIPTGGTVSLPLSGSPTSASYETASLDTSGATFTVRDYPSSPEREIPPDRWAFATCQRDEQTGEAVNSTPSRKDICLFDGFDPNQLYQLTYTARNPRPLALGFAITRDLLSFLRYAGADGSGRIPGVQPGVPNELTIRDYGPGVTPAGGIITTSPGTELTGSSYTTLVPRTDADGLDLAGLRRPDDVQTPIATLNGWNVRGSGFRAGELCGLNGQYVPFEATEAERRASGDPRPSLEERYPTHEDYVGGITIAAMDMAANGYLLAEDVDRMLSAAADAPVP